jgi:hypothetical protein
MYYCVIIILLIITLIASYFEGSTILNFEGFRGGGGGGGSGSGSYGSGSGRRSYGSGSGRRSYGSSSGRGSSWGRDGRGTHYRYGDNWGRNNWGRNNWGNSGWGSTGWTRWDYPYYPIGLLGTYPLWNSYWYGGNNDICDYYAKQQCLGDSICYNYKVNNCYANSQI